MASSAVVAAAVLVALAIRCRLGFGFSLVFVPIASVVGEFADAFRTSLILEVVVGSMLAWRLRTSLRLLDALALKAYGFVGVGAGAAIRTVVSLRALVAVAMTVVFMTCAIWLTQPKRRWRRGGRKLAFAGATSGLLNSWTSLAGPPVVLYYLATEESDDDVRGALTGYFLLLYIGTVGILGMTGVFDDYENWTWAAVGVSVVLVSFRWVEPWSKRLPTDLTRASLVVLMITALAVGVRAVIG